MNSTKNYNKIKTQAERLAIKNRDLHREVTHEDYKVEKLQNIKEGENGCFRKIIFVDIRGKMKTSIFNVQNPISDRVKKYIERYREDDAYWEMPLDGYFKNNVLSDAVSAPSSEGTLPWVYAKAIYADRDNQIEEPSDWQF